MTRLDRYILAQLLRVFGFFSLILISVYWVNKAVWLFDQLISDGQPVTVFLEFTALSLPMLIRTVLPIAGFIAATYVTVSLMRNSEIPVLQAAGISPIRLLRPVILFGLIVTGFMLVLMHVLIPEARSQLSRRQAEVAQNITSGLLQDGVFQHPAEGVTFFIGSITPEGVMRGIYLSDARSTLQRIDYTARTALVVPERDGPKLVMIEGQAQIHDHRTGRLSITEFSDFTYDLSGLIGPPGNGRLVQELPTSALWSPTPDLLVETGSSLAQVRFELMSRFTDALAALVAALIGYAALVSGGFNRLGFWRQVLSAVVVLLVMLGISNAAAGAAMRSVSLSWLTLLPLVMGLAASLGMIGWSMRKRRRRGSDGATP